MIAKHSLSPECADSRVLQRRTESPWRQLQFIRAKQCCFDIMCIQCSGLVAFEPRLDKEDSEQRKVDAAAFWVEALCHQLQPKNS